VQGIPLPPRYPCPCSRRDAARISIYQPLPGQIWAVSVRGAAIPCGLSIEIRALADGWSAASTPASLMDVAHRTSSPDNGLCH